MAGVSVRDFGGKVGQGTSAAFSRSLELRVASHHVGRVLKQPVEMCFGRHHPCSCISSLGQAFR